MPPTMLLRRRGLDYAAKLQSEQNWKERAEIIKAAENKQ
jgi:hypothetical protein